MSTTSATANRLSSDYDRIAAAIRFLEENSHDQPTLAAMAASVGMSESHFHRLFSRWVGITPQRFLQALTAEYAKECLARSRTVMEAAWDSGLSGGGRLHDLMINVEAMTPGEIRSGGEGLTIRTGTHESPFGACWLGVTDRGICALEFLDERTAAQAEEELARKWPGARIVQRPRETAAFIQRIFAKPSGSSDDSAPRPITLLVKGTNFQIKVWQALLRIPSGCMVSYGDIAKGIGNSRASQAVGSAVGSNPVSFLIPCHRVIRSLGKFGNYRWGAARKKAILGWEAASLATAG